MKIKVKYNEKIRNLIKENEQLMDEKNDLELKINETIQSQEVVKALYQKEIIMMKGQKVEAERKANENYETMQKIIARKNEIISNLKNEIDELKKENAEEISKITEDTNRSLLELKAIYEKEKPKPPQDPETIEALKSEQDSLKSELDSLKTTIKSLEASESMLKDQLKSKDDHIEKVTRKLRIKASESPKSSTDLKDLTELAEALNEKLIEKDIEISKLKKTIGELRLDLVTSTNKPPIHSPKSYRSMTFITKFDPPSTESFFSEKNEEFQVLKKYEKMVCLACSLQCEKCLEKFKKEEFFEHIENCQDDSSKDRVLDESEKIDELEKIVEKLKLGLANMKSQRDKAKIEAEKMLMQLKDAKLKLAETEECLEERIMDIREEFRGFVEVVIKVVKGSDLHSSVKYEIERAIRRSDKFFGGRLTKSFVN